MSSGQGRARPRVAIIGGGSVGALTAVRLARAGFNVTALEKAAIGNGSSSRSAACIRSQFGVPDTVAGMMYSTWFYDHFAEFTGIPDGNEGPIILHNGYLFLYELPERAADFEARQELESAWRQAQASVEMQRKLGLDVEILSPEEIYSRWSHLEQDVLVGGTWCKQDGFLRGGRIYNHGFECARDLGVTVMTDTEVTGVEHRSSVIIALQTTKGLVEVDYVVNATNAWGRRVSRMLGGMELAIEPLKRFLYTVTPTREMVATVGGEDAWRNLPMTIYGMGKGRGSYSRPENVQLMFGWAHPTLPEHEFEDRDQDYVPPSFHPKSGDDNYYTRLREQVVDFAPELVDGQEPRVSGGYYATTPDATPLIGFDANQSNLVHAVGCSGHGLMHAPITAFLVEQLLQDGVGQDGRVLLPEPFNQHAIAIGTFDPRRDFAHSAKESHVI